MREIIKTTNKVVYLEDCICCGEEFKTRKNSKKDICDKCQETLESWKVAQDDIEFADHALKVLTGATITEINATCKLNRWGYDSAINYVSLLDTDGNLWKLEVCTDLTELWQLMYKVK